MPRAKILDIPESRTAEHPVGKTMQDFEDVKDEDEIDLDIEFRLTEHSIYNGSSGNLV